MTSSVLTNQVFVEQFNTIEQKYEEAELNRLKRDGGLASMYKNSGIKDVDEFCTQLVEKGCEVPIPTVKKGLIYGGIYWVLSESKPSLYPTGCNQMRQLYKFVKPDKYVDAWKLVAEQVAKGRRLNEVVMNLKTILPADMLK